MCVVPESWEDVYKWCGIDLKNILPNGSKEIIIYPTLDDYV
ncbi:MAG: hypothetical protein QXO19_03350 [Candidatus Aenigmatarchaeota archaeon]